MAAETKSGMEILGFTPIKAVFFALLAGWLLASAARLTVALLELPRLLFRVLSDCCRRVSPAKIGAAYSKPALQGTTRCLETCDMCAGSLPPSERCSGQCSLEVGHEFTDLSLVYGTHSCLRCLTNRRHYPSAAPSAAPRQSRQTRTVRDVATQSQCTYSSVAKALHPRFNGVMGFTGMVEHSPPRRVVAAL